MKARVIYESIFGNTKEIAEAIGDGLRDRYDEVEVTEVSVADPDAEAGLLVVGGPTHVFSMSRPSTRKAGAEQAERQHVTPASTGIGIREWLARIPASAGQRAAAFDTGAGRFGIIGSGSAARKEAAELERKGYRLVAAPEQFLIAMEKDCTTLKPGERERAVRWGQQIAAAS